MRRLRAPLGLAVLVLVLGFPALSRYGVTWDEALGDYFFGERYLDFFLSFDPRYLDFAADPYPEGHVPDLSASPFRDRPWEYYPVANVAAAATSRLISGGLGWLDPFDGFHALNLLLGASLAAALYVFVRRRFDATAALVASVLLFTSPRIAADLLSNIKDLPEAVLFSLALFAFAAAWERGSMAGVAASGVLWGLALGTKANALFLPAIVIFTVMLAAQPTGWRARRRVAWSALAAFGAAGAVTVFGLWPYLWAAPLERVREHLGYIGLRLFATRPESVISPLAAIAYTTPLPFLALAVAGVAIAVRELVAGRRARRDAAPGVARGEVPRGERGGELRYLLPLVWVAVVLVRLHLPGAVNFDGVRHFLELFPPLAILGGVAASRLASGIRGDASASWPAPRRAAATGVLVLLLVPGAAATLRVHPFELAYWNALAGGLDGARAKGLAQAGDYWAGSYRIGIDWLNQRAPAGTALAVPLAQHTVELVASIRLRTDIGVIDIAQPARPELRPDTFAILEQVASERPVYVMFALRDDWTNDLIEDCRSRLRPLVHWSVDGEPVLVIYRWTPDLEPGARNAASSERSSG